MNETKKKQPRDVDLEVSLEKKDNMTYWNRICKSDPRHLKSVSFGARKFTSIDPQYQIQKMTETFGPVGKGWGYEVDYDYPTAGTTVVVIAKVTIWWTATISGIHDWNNKFSYGPVGGSRTLMTDGMKRPNEEAAKMAMTDALTKALSHLGCDANIFLGKQDGSKYVADDKKSNDNPF
tara:strand:- start:1067 stop:1600 length:534 start_codon:yes stop_codon:yes gene_type:complete